MEKMEIGKILTTVGLKGEMKVLPETKDINRFKKLKEIYINKEKYVVEYAHVRNDRVCLKLVGVNKIEEALVFRNKLIFIDREDSVALDKDEYFAVDLMGCQVYNNENYIGLITEVANYGASDIIFLKNKGVEKSFVYVEDLFETVDLENKKIYVTDKIQEVLCD